MKKSSQKFVKDLDHELLDAAIAQVEQERENENKKEIERLKLQEKIRCDQIEIENKKKAEMDRILLEREQKRLDAIRIEKEQEHSDHISKYYNIIKTSLIDDNLNEINVKCKTSYDRLCIYKAIEQFQTNYDIVLTRKKVYDRVTLDRIRCRKHFLPAYGACDCCSDPYCSGPTCEKGCDKIRDFLDPDDIKPIKMVVAIKILKS